MAKDMEVKDTDLNVRCVFFPEDENGSSPLMTCFHRADYLKFNQ